MLSKITTALLLGFIAIPTASSQDTHAERSVYLNGIDISSARNQKLKGVDVHIDENGNIFFTAPHYDVLEEGSYVPLSKWTKKMGTSEMHKAPTELKKGMMPPPPSSKMPMNSGSDKELENQPSETENAPIEKPGSDWQDADQRET